LVEGRWPLISTLPAAPARPRVSSSPSSNEKPGSRLTMSSAVSGLEAAKKAGSKTRTPRASPPPPAACEGSGRGAWAAAGPASIETAAPASQIALRMLSFPCRRRMRRGGARLQLQA
jgi:hypothetical protein